MLGIPLKYTAVEKRVRALASLPTQVPDLLFQRLHSENDRDINFARCSDEKT
jgi:hypothetical protein